MTKEQANKLRTWVEPKEVEIHTIKQNIESAELRVKHTKENIEGGWYVKQAKKKILEAPTEFARESEKFELEKLESDIKNGFIGRADEMTIKELNVKLKMAEDALKGIKKAIIKAERNHEIKGDEAKELNKLAPKKVAKSE